MNLNTTLARLEKRLQKLVEDRLDGIFTTIDLQKMLSHELLAALQHEARPTSDGQILVPDRYIIYLPLETMKHLSTYHNQIDELTNVLAEAIEDFSRQAGYVFTTKISIQILADRPVIPSQAAKASILATFTMQENTQTATVGFSVQPSGSPTAESANEQTARAFLIVNGVDIFPLPGRYASGVINIGRISGNQLVLEDGRVSRTHAQLRIMQGRYMLFDLASTQGTYVNGVRINQQELKAGDVISFGGVPVVFGIEDQPSNPSISLPTKQLSD